MIEAMKLARQVTRNYRDIPDLVSDSELLLVGEKKAPQVFVVFNVLSQSFGSPGGSDPIVPTILDSDRVAMQKHTWKLSTVQLLEL